MPFKITFFDLVFFINETTPSRTASSVGILNLRLSTTLARASSLEHTNYNVQGDTQKVFVLRALWQRLGNPHMYQHLQKEIPVSVQLNSPNLFSRSSRCIASLCKPISLSIVLFFNLVASMSTMQAYQNPSPQGRCESLWVGKKLWGRTFCQTKPLRFWKIWQTGISFFWAGRKKWLW